MTSLRNVAIIAHVDHGKTTLVDALLKQSKTKLNKDVADTTCILDSNDLERERGITIFSKNASVQWKDTKINIIDTPGHADFGGEVERVLKMADGCLLLVDAKEGPMPQTRFVLKHALARKLRIIVLINKIDKPDARIDYVMSKTFDLFIELGADEDVAYFPVLYASAKQGKAGTSPDLATMTDITPIFDALLSTVPAPTADPTLPLQLLATTISADTFKGRIATGRIANGSIKAGQEIMHINREGEQKKARLTSLMTFEGLERIDVKEAFAGDIVAVSGMPDIMIGETIADPVTPIALPLLKIEEPTVKMTFGINTSPVAGKEGDFCTSRQIRARLYKELETDTALRVEDTPDGGWIVSGRGELHLAICIERLRREGYEFEVSSPEVIIKIIDGKKMTPYEKLFIEVPEEYQGVVIQKLGSRYGELLDMRTDSGICFMEFIIPTRSLLGYRGEFLTDTRGLGIINSIFEDYKPDPGKWQDRTHGSLVSHETGVTTLYSLIGVQARGQLFVDAGTPVYKGQVVGQHTRDNDLSVNVTKGKQLTNIRSKGDGVSEHFNAPKIMILEEALQYIGDDELVEVTPKSIRIRKTILDIGAEKRKKLGLV